MTNKKVTECPAESNFPVERIPNFMHQNSNKCFGVFSYFSVTCMWLGEGGLVCLLVCFCLLVWFLVFGFGFVVVVLSSLGFLIFFSDKE